MKLDNIIKELQDLFGDDFTAVEIGTWTEKVKYIHILVRYSSLYQAMEITRITGDADPLICGGYDNKVKVIANVKRTT